MRTGIEITKIPDDGQKDRNVGTNSDERFCSRQICSNPRNPRIWGHTIDQKVPSQPHEMQISNPVKKWRGNDESTECLLDRLPDDIEHDILSRLSISDLLRARVTCHAWDDTISSSHIFQLLYDQRNRESWIALTSHPQNPYDFGLFNNNPNPSKWYFIRGTYGADVTESWFLQGTADGFMLFVSTEGNIKVTNPLTKRFRLLPDIKFSLRLGLQSCLKRKLRGSKSNSKSTPSTTAQLSLSIHLVVDAAKFKVIVWGELRTHMVHALVYSSATDKWTVRECPDINFRLFKLQFHATAVEDTIYFYSITRSMLATYNTETGLFVAEQINLPLRQGQLTAAMDRVRVHTIKLVVHKSQVFLLGIIFGYIFNRGHHASLIGLWQAAPTRGVWNLLTTQPLQTSLRDASHEEVAAAYDGEQNVTIIPKALWSKVRFLNLDTKEWTMSDEDSQAWRLSGGKAPQEQIAFSTPFMAFHLKLKFCTVI